MLETHAKGSAMKKSCLRIRCWNSFIVQLDDSKPRVYSAAPVISWSLLETALPPMLLMLSKGAVAAKTERLHAKRSAWSSLLISLWQRSRGALYATCAILLEGIAVNGIMQKMTL